MPITVSSTQCRLSAPNAESIAERVDEHGFCVAEGVVTYAECARLRAALELFINVESLQGLSASGHQRVSYLAAKHPAFLNALCHPIVLDVWRTLLSKDLICSTFTANVLWPGAIDGDWHVDHPYWTLTQPYQSLPLTGQCIWPLDGFTQDNGATVGIAGSHRRDHRPPNLQGDWSDHAEALTAPPGSVLFAHGAWWHASRRNRTNAIRAALLVTYTHTFCVPQDDMRRQLEYIDAPTDLVVELLGGKQYEPGIQIPH